MTDPDQSLPRDTDQSFPKRNRIKSSADFDRVFKKGVVISDDVLVVHVAQGLYQLPRLGLSLTKRIGIAPLRNRWKRLIREVFRINKSRFPNFDIVVRPKKGATPSFDAISRSLPRLIAKAARKLP